jgi:protein-S-isoprenylcysteine O-methyltransferase Ste14
VGGPEVEEGGHGGELLTEGPYAVIRNPRYVEIVLGTMAYVTFANWTGPYLVAIGTILAIHAVVLLEERELVQRFGEEFEAYRSRVPRYIPNWGKS